MMILGMGGATFMPQNFLMFRLWHNYLGNNSMSLNKKGFLYRNGLSLVFTLMFLIAIVGQIFTGMSEHNKELIKDKSAPIGLVEYLSSGHFMQATFENWESEFLQMALFVVLTISLRQQGSSESKKLEGKEEVDREPNPRRKNAPWQVKKGGWILKLYKNSLSISLFTLFLLSFCIHFAGSLKDSNEEQRHLGLPPDSVLDYIASSRFWFESFQNWQSEFLSVVAIVVLSIHFRQKGSPQSKPVDAPNEETGE
jgi:hypothetical protein